MAPLALGESGPEPVQVWTRLSLAAGRGERELTASLAGARTLVDGWAWWGENLAVLDHQRSGRGGPQARLDQLEALEAPAAPLQRAMAAEPARRFLGAWRPWQLLSGLAGGPLGEPVSGAAFAAEPDGDSLRLRARLDLAG